MKNKLPFLIGAIIVIAGLVFFMGGGDKTAKTVIFAVDAIKDGKQAEEWLIYDRTAFAEISK